jgi:tetratricopeptide (TPR) repeat protein
MTFVLVVIVVAQISLNLLDSKRSRASEPAVIAKPAASAAKKTFASAAKPAPEKERWAEIAHEGEDIAQTGDAKTALVFFRKALAQAELLGEDDIRLTASLRLVGREVISSHTNYEEGVRLLRREQDILVRKLGPDFPGRAFGLYWIGIGLNLLGKPDEAIVALNECLRIAPKGSVRNIDWKNQVYPEIAAAYRAQKKYKLAESMVRKNIAHVRRVDGDTNPQRIHALHYVLAELFYVQQKYAEAESELQTALLMLEGKRWDTARDFVMDNNLYASVERDRGNLEHSLRLLNAIAVLERSRPDAIVDRQQFHLTLSDANKNLGKLQEAKYWADLALRESNANNHKDAIWRVKDLEQKLKVK